MSLQAGHLEIGAGTPKICVPLTGATREEILEQASGALGAGADLVEWRVDYYGEAADTAAVLGTVDTLSDRLGDIPIIFTFRTKEEGGEREISIKDYEQLLLAAADQGKVSIIDVEVYKEGLEPEDFIEKIHKKNLFVLASNHHFEGTPFVREMMNILEEMEEMGADILKLAVMPKAPEDVLNLLQATRRISAKTPRPVITMSMGKMGVVSRISGEIFGSAVTFATAGKASAPGQIPVEEMRKILKILA